MVMHATAVKLGVTLDQYLAFESAAVAEAFGFLGGA